MAGCGSCAAAAARRRGLNNKYQWTGTTSTGETVSVTYDDERQAKAKVLRKGGSYVVVPAPVGG